MTKEKKETTKKNNVKNVKKTRADEYLDPKTKKFKRGNPGGGRTPGSRDWTTDFNEAVEIIAKASGLPQSKIRTDLMVKGIGEARRGNFNFWREIVERSYGKIKEEVDINLTARVKKLKDIDKNLRKIIGK